MGDSDDDYDTMSKRRGQSRNKFRKERDDFHENNNNNNDSQNEMSGSRRNKSGMDSNNGNGINRLHHSSNGGPYMGNHNTSMPYNSDYRRRPSAPHHMDKDLEDLDEDDLAHQTYRDASGFRNERQRYSHGYGSTNRSLSPPPMPQAGGRHFGGHRESMYDGYLPPNESNYGRHDYDDLSSSIGYKRPAYMENNYYPGSNNHHGSFNNQLNSHGLPSSYYDNMHLSKKPRRDWSVLERSNQVPGSNYFEHDNRLAPDLDEYNDEYGRDFSSSRQGRPPKYATPYKFDHRFNSPLNQPSSGDAFRNGSGVGPAIPGKMGFNGNNHSSTITNGLQTAAQAFMNTMVSQVAPIIQSQINQTTGYSNSPANFVSGPVNNQINNTINNNNVDMNTFEMQTQPQMMSFKQFLFSINNSNPNSKLTPEESNKLYNEYKIKFRREQTAIFFNIHKNEEWFRFRYHPIDSSKRKEEHRETIKRRLQSFIDLLDYFKQDENGYLSLEMGNDLNKKRLFRFLDAAMIKLEGGSDKDLAILDNIYDFNEKDKNEEDSKLNEIKDENANVEEKSDEVNQDEDLVKVCITDKELLETKNVTKQNGDNKKVESESIPQKTQSIFFKHLPVIVTRSDLEKIGNKYPGFLRASISEPAPERRFQRRGWITFDSSVNIKDVCSKINGTRLHDMMLNAAINRELDQKTKLISGLSNHKEIIRNDLKLICKVVENMDKRWGLWQYSNIYEENRKKEEEELTKIDLTYKRSKNKNKEVAALDDKEKNSETTENLALKKSAKEKNESENISNGECTNEIEENSEHQNGKPDNGEITEKSVTNETNEEKLNKNPLLISALNYLENLNELKLKEKESKEKIETIVQIEEKMEIEVKTNEETANISENFEDDIKNDDAIECKLDEELLEPSKKEREETPAVKKSDLKNDNGKITIKNQIVEMEKDDEAAKFLDNLILYLRIVHSIDYYNATEYQQEDWMPNRLGIMHVRGPVDLKLPNSDSVNVINGMNISYYDKNNLKRLQLDEWLRLFEIHIRPYSDYREKVEPEVAKRLGLKDTKEELENFMSINCKKIEKNIWLCPLSGKKFKGPDYVRKHIETKHAHKLEELKKEIDYFNRFVYDPKRPYLPEHPLNKNMNNQNFYNNNNNNMNNYQNMLPNAYGLNSYPSDYNMPYSGRSNLQGSYSSVGYSNYQSPYPKNSNFNSYSNQYHSSSSLSSSGYPSGYSSSMSDEYNPYHNNHHPGGGYYSSSNDYSNPRSNQLPMHHSSSSGYNSLNKLPRR